MKEFLTKIYQKEKSKVASNTFIHKCANYISKKTRSNKGIISYFLCSGVTCYVIFLLLIKLFFNENLVGDFVFFSLCMIASITVSLVLSWVCLNYISSKEKKFEKNILHFIQSEANQKEMKETLFKMNLIAYYNNINDEIIDPKKFKDYVNKIDSKTLPNSIIEEVAKLIASPLLLEKYLIHNKAFFNLSIEELEFMIKTKMANVIVTYEKDMEEQKEFLKSYATESENAIFKQTKSLTLNL